MNALVSAWIWACETRLILAPAAVGTWLLCRYVYRAAWRWATRQTAPAWDWRDDLDPAERDQAEMDIADGLDRLFLHLGTPPLIEQQPAPEDDTSRYLNALYYAKENEQ